MGLFLKIATVTVLMLVLALHPVRLQDTSETTAAPRQGRTIDKDWLRVKLPLKSVDPPNLMNDEPSADYPSMEESGVESRMDSSGGVASGGFLLEQMEEEVNATTDNPNELHISPNETTTVAPENQGSNVSTATQLPSGDANVTRDDVRNNETVSDDAAEEIRQNTTVALNGTEAPTTIPVSEKNVTTAMDVGSGEGISNETESNVTITLAPPGPETTAQEESEGPTVTGSTTVTSPETTTTYDPFTTERANLSDKGAAPSGGTAERGFESETGKRRKNSQWGAVLGTFVAIAVVGLAAYVILKKKHQKAFSHRKLDEEFPSDPVLRLDNSEPLDLNYGRAAYYNPALQGDNIQMSPFPKN